MTVVPLSAKKWVSRKWQLTHFSSMLHFYTPWKRQGVWKWNIGLEWVHVYYVNKWIDIFNCNYFNNFNAQVCHWYHSHERVRNPETWHWFCKVIENLRYDPGLERRIWHLNSSYMFIAWPFLPNLLKINDTFSWNFWLAVFAKILRLFQSNILVGTISITVGTESQLLCVKPNLRNLKINLFMLYLLAAEFQNTLFYAH